MIKHLTINTEKIKKETTILLLSDLHKAKKDKNKKLNKLSKKLEKEMDKVDGIIITGDIINSPRDLTNKGFVSELIISLLDFTKSKPTIVCTGNHDITMTPDGEKYLRSIFQAVKNLKCLENDEIASIKEIKIAGFNPTMKYYKKGKKEEFLKQYNKSNKKEFNKDTYNIFITHDPTSIISLSKENKEFLKPNTDLLVAGHMHNGLVPNILQKITFHHGFVGPYKKMFPNYCHGTLKIKETQVIILGAVNTIMRHPILNKMYSPNATVLTIKPKQKIKA